MARRSDPVAQLSEDRVVRSRAGCDNLVLSGHMIDMASMAAQNKGASGPQN